MVASRCPKLTAEAVRGSLYKVWAVHSGLRIEGAEERIRVVSARGTDARALKLSDGAAGMLIQSVGYLAAHRPLWWARTLYRGDSNEFHSRLDGIPPEGYSRGEFLEISDKAL